MVYLIPFLAPLIVIGAAGAAITTKAVQEAIGSPEIPSIDFGVTETLDRIGMMMIISTVCMVVLAVTFTYLYPKWSK